MENLKGYISHIVYRNEENGYTVFELISGGEEVTCTGFPPSVSEGESCRLTGGFVNHPIYGKQFHMDSYAACAPENAQAVFRYLSSGAVKGVGEALAGRIIQAFGEDSMRILEEEPERLAEVKGISRKKAREIAGQLSEKKELRDAMIFMQQYGITNKQALKIWKTYEMGLYEVLKENPYRLVEDIDGIGFVSADEIAARIGMQADSDFRIRSGILYVLNRAQEEGHSYLPRRILTERAVELLSLPDDRIELQLENLTIERLLFCRTLGEEVQVYSVSAWLTEQKIARLLLELDGYRPDRGIRADVEEKIRALEIQEQIELDDLQRNAVQLAVENAVLLISGGPGTGKTTTIRTILRYFEEEHMEVLLAAPTGRAAKRMSSLTGYEAVTIHRLLGVHPAGEETGERKSAADGRFAVFSRNEEEPLEADALIVDEMSMVDMHLFLALLKAIRPGTRLIMVGDRNQLPSVGPGKILQDLICSGHFKTIMLEKIFRQAAQSDIVLNAHHILHDEPLKYDNKSRDFFFLERNEPALICKNIVQLMRDMLPGYLHCGVEEIQVLSPMKKGTLGVIRLNEALQSVLNPPESGKREMQRQQGVFREGDKVMQMRNNYQIAWEVRGSSGVPVDSGTGVFNGDFGIIKEIDPAAEQLTVRFDDDRMVTYTLPDAEDLELAYAITVHKSQGSEYPAVILPLLSGPQALLNRNLLYTAVTRAKGCVVIIGSRDTLEQMKANADGNVRYTGLEERIAEFA